MSRKLSLDENVKQHRTETTLPFMMIRLWPEHHRDPGLMDERGLNQ